MGTTAELAIPSSPLLSPPNIPPYCSSSNNKIHPSLFPFLRIKHSLPTDVNKV
jgi:hypothetical protein